jgi:XTP/dITP diphosphohydrolase
MTGSAWRLLDGAAVIATADLETALSRAVRAEGLEVREVEQPSAESLLALAATDEVVWLAGDAGDDELIRSLAAEIVNHAEDAAGPSEPVVEVVVGSYDPAGARLLDLVEVMDRLRRECPWDKEQTHESLVRYLLEETYETIEAIETGDRDHLQEELGDLLLQVYFHARVASEDPDEPFAIDDVAAGIVEKLVRRHPHVFGDADSSDVAAVEANWESIKAEEKSRSSVIDGIPLGLPALSLAAKVISRVTKGAAELSVPVPGQAAYDAGSLGEVLFALVAAAHAAGLDPEQALRERVRAEIDAVRVHEENARRV